MGNVEATTKFSRLKSVSSIEDNCFFIVIYLFSRVSFTITKVNYNPL